MGRRIFELSIGVSVSATIIDTMTVATSVKANSVNRLPVRPLVKPIGMNTATSVVDITRIGLASSRTPFIAASNGDCPSSIRRWMFSSTMIASSTTRPMASTMASRVSRLIEKPAASMMTPAPITDSGMATAGSSSERREPRKRKITMTTTPSVIAIVSSTSSSAAVMNTLWS